MESEVYLDSVVKSHLNTYKCSSISTIPQANTRETHLSLEVPFSIERPKHTQKKVIITTIITNETDQLKKSKYYLISKNYLRNQTDIF